MCRECSQNVRTERDAQTETEVEAREVDSALLPEDLAEAWAAAAREPPLSAICLEVKQK